jgi:hypothetical protein
MILDKNMLFSDAQAETTVAAHASDSYIDIVKAGDAEKELYLVIRVNTAVTSGGAATVQFKLETDDNSSFSSAATVWDSGAIAKATLVQGYTVVMMRIPKNKLERYTRVTYTIGTAVLTAGAFDAYLTMTPDNGLV